MFGAGLGRGLTTMFGVRTRHESSMVAIPRHMGLTWLLDSSVGLAWLLASGASLSMFLDLGVGLAWLLDPGAACQGCQT
jgi:hypothetical protein